MSSASSAAPIVDGGRPGGEDQRPRPVDQQCRQLLAAAGERAVAAQRLGERAHDHVDLGLEPQLGDQPAARRPDDTGGVRLVDDDAGAMAAGQLDDSLQRREIAIHRKDRVGDDRRPPSAGAAQPVGQRVQVGVRVDDRLGAGQAAAVDQGGVVEGVGEHDLTRAGQGRHDAGIGQEARAEQRTRLRALERRQLLLELAVRGHVARDQARRSGARAPLQRKASRGGAHARSSARPR